jgi:hypothetical protein
MLYEKPKAPIWILVILILAIASTGCARLPVLLPADLPTAFPTEYLSTAIALTVAAARSLPAEATPGEASPTPFPTPFSITATSTLSTATITSPTAVSETIPSTATPARSTRTPTLTPTTEIPFAPVQILSPGPGSRVVSPIPLSAFLEPGAKGNVIVELFGEDGRLLVRLLKTYTQGDRVYINLDIDYEIAAVAEAGRLQISTRDEYGRLIALTSTDLLLLSIGDAEINPPGDLLGKIIIQQPKSRALIQGGKLRISGLARSEIEGTLIAEMQTTDGKPLGPTRLIDTVDSEFSGYSSFTSEIPYSIKTSTWVRLQVYELSTRMPGITYLTSIELLLSP